MLDGPGGTEEEEQVQMYLLALKNVLLPEAVPLLTRFAESETGALSITAITALQRYPPALITAEVSTHAPAHSTASQSTQCRLEYLNSQSEHTMQAEVLKSQSKHALQVGVLKHIL